MFGDSGDAKAKTMIVDGGTTELSPGDVLRYVKDPRTGRRTSLKAMTPAEIESKQKELLVPGAEVTVRIMDPDVTDEASVRLRKLHHER